MTRIRTTRQARKLRPMAKVLVARKRFWKIAESLLVTGPFTDQKVDEYYQRLADKWSAESKYVRQGGNLRDLRGARVLD